MASERGKRLVEVLERMDIGKDNWASAVALAQILGDDVDALQVEIEDGFNLGIGFIDWSDAQELSEIVNC